MYVCAEDKTKCIGNTHRHTHNSSLCPYVLSHSKQSWWEMGTVITKSLDNEHDYVRSLFPQWRLALWTRCVLLRHACFACVMHVLHCPYCIHGSVCMFYTVHTVYMWVSVCVCVCVSVCVSVCLCTSGCATSFICLFVHVCVCMSVCYYVICCMYYMCAPIQCIYYLFTVSQWGVGISTAPLKCLDHRSRVEG